MAESKQSSGRTGSMKIDSELVRQLAELLTETGLTEIEVEESGRKIRVSRGGGVALAAAPAPAAPAAAPAEAPAPAESTPTVEGAIKSPMVGTAYLSSEPGAAPFVNVGDAVKPGDTLLIVEAMKVMNPITATQGGTVRAVLVENAQPVEYDQPLVVVA
jgi:acetyl-CoA carboxylase biotin carboxyl carrier protein